MLVSFPFASLEQLQLATHRVVFPPFPPHDFSLHLGSRSSHLFFSSKTACTPSHAAMCGCSPPKPPRPAEEVVLRVELGTRAFGAGRTAAHLPIKCWWMW